jgi:hypothetical protein
MRIKIVYFCCKCFEIPSMVLLLKPGKKRRNYIFGALKTKRMNYT